MDLSEIYVGQIVIDDGGLERTVYQIHRSQDLVVLDGEDGRFEMSLEGLAQAIEDGEFEEVTGDEAEEED